MTLSRRAKWWGAAGLLGLVLAGLGVYFAAVGLEEADRLASVGGLFVGLLGLALAAYGTYAARGATHPPAPLPPGRPGSGGGVHGNTFHGPAAIQSGEHNRQENNFRS